MNPSHRLRSVVVVLLLAGLPAPTPAQIPDRPNATSPLGINFTFFRDAVSEWSIVDIFRQSRDWTYLNCAPHCASIQLDAEGWIVSMPQGTVAQTRMLGGFGGHYPAGPYIVTYQGQGTIQYLGDASLVQSTPGKDVIQVTPTDLGIRLNITAIDPADHLRDLHVILPGYDETDFETVPDRPRFHPSFTDKIANYKTLRFLNWQETNASQLVDWVDRPVLADARWSRPGRGVPLEILVDLANQLHADAWFNVPHMATDDFVTQFATLVRDTLSPDLRVYVEYSNEVWANATPGLWVEQQAVALWPGGAASDYDKRLQWFGMRTAQICDSWKAVWGAQADRVRCVMATSGFNSGVSVQELDCPLWPEGAPCHAHGIDALAIGAYFGGYLGTPGHQPQVQSWTADPDGGLDKLFQELQQGGALNGGQPGGAVQATLNAASAQRAVAAARGLAMVAYEGGQALYGSGGVENDAAVTGLFTAANRDPRMGSAYDQFFAGWRALGGELFNHFNHVGQSSGTGNWGSLEYMDQAGSPKYDALMRFVAGNPCWWSGCAPYLPAGSVPAGSGAGVPLMIDKSGSGDLFLSWGAGCVGLDTDYSVYEGGLGSFTSHAPIACQTGGATTWTLTPAAGDAYYLVVSQNGTREGSYGFDALGAERPPALAACNPQSIAACP